MAMFYVGTSGWSYDHWIDKFYPPEMKKNEWFSFYTSYFNSVELNMSFYRYPFTNMLKGWKKRMPSGFKMTFKAIRRITHYQKFKNVEKELYRFYGLVDTISGNAGCILFQTPPHFICNTENFDTLRQFLQLTDPEKRNVLEFRHSSWWNDEVYALLREHKAGFCIVSGLGMPSEAVFTNSLGYFRFHGPDQAYASQYSEEQLNEWAEIIKSAVVEYELNEVYCYFNNDNSGYAVDDAGALQRLVFDKTN